MSPISPSTRTELSPTTASSHALYRHDIAPHNHVTLRVRSWQKIDRSAFTQAIKDNCLGGVPSPSLTAEYDTVLRSIADPTALRRCTRCAVVFGHTHRGSTPNAGPLAVLAASCMERRYRRTKTDNDRSVFFASLQRKHAEFAAKKNRYWAERIAEERGNSTNIAACSRCLRFCVVTIQISDGVIEAYCR